jgi:hypothetical protein
MFVQRILFLGVVDRRRLTSSCERQIPSIPRAITYIPELHAIAVLCREHTSRFLSTEEGYFGPRDLQTTPSDVFFFFFFFIFFIHVDIFHWLFLVYVCHYNG